jgi:phage-related protein
MAEPPEKKPCEWIASSKDDLLSFPDDVQQVFGYALYVAQMCGRHVQAKIMKGFGHAGVLELVEDHDGDTFRAIYTTRLKGKIYVLHAFQKKSKKGIATPKSDLDLIKKRLKAAEAHAAAEAVAAKGTKR